HEVRPDRRQLQHHILRRHDPADQAQPPGSHGKAVLVPSVNHSRRLETCSSAGIPSKAAASQTVLYRRTPLAETESRARWPRTSTIAISETTISPHCCRKLDQPP